MRRGRLHVRTRPGAWHERVVLAPAHDPATVTRTETNQPRRTPMGTSSSPGTLVNLVRAGVVPGDYRITVFTGYADTDPAPHWWVIQHRGMRSLNGSLSATPRTFTVTADDLLTRIDAGQVRLHTDPIR